MLGAGSPSRTGTSPRRRRRGLAWQGASTGARGGSWLEGKLEFHCRTASHPRAIRTDGPTMLLDERLADGQAKPDAPPDVLRREEWIEDMRQVLSTDTAARVRHAHHGMRRSHAVMFTARTDDYLSRSIQRVDRVVDQVEHDLTQHDCICADEDRRLVGHHGDLRTQGFNARLHERNGISHHAAYIDRVESRCSLTNVVKESVHDLGGPLRLAVGSPQVLRKVDELGMLSQGASRA